MSGSYTLSRLTGNDELVKYERFRRTAVRLPII